MMEQEQRWRVRAGESLILLPDAAHACWKSCDAVTRFFWVHFQTVGQWQCVDHYEPVSPAINFYVYNPINRFSITIPQHGLLYDPQKTYFLIHKLNESHKNQTSPNTLWQQQLLFQETLMTLYAPQDEAPLSTQAKVTEHVVEFLMDNYQQTITNEDISKRLSYHVGYINRCMQQVYGCTALAYLRQYRIERAKPYLINTRYSMEFIASRNGFSNAAHFRKCFKMTTGISPQQFRCDAMDNQREN